MNTKLILQLSLFGLAVAIATVFWIPSSVEPFLWLIIFIISALLIAKRCRSKYFLHGFLVSLANCVWVTTAHIIFFSTYLANHPREADMLSKSGYHESPRLMMLLAGTAIGILSGLVLGLFAFAASKIIAKKR